VTGGFIVALPANYAAKPALHKPALHKPALHKPGLVLPRDLVGKSGGRVSKMPAAVRAHA
jgi:hypothetical protein